MASMQHRILSCVKHDSAATCMIECILLETWVDCVQGCIKRDPDGYLDEFRQQVGLYGMQRALICRQ